MMVTVIGRGHSGTRAMSHTLTASGFYMGAEINNSGDLIPPEEFYEACRVMARYVVHKGGLDWDFSRLHSMPIDPAFTRLVESYLASVLNSKAEHKGWKLPETTLVYPWIVRLFPDIHYIHWVRDPRDSIIGKHLTDNLADFGVPYDKPDNLRFMRAISWKYQRDIVKATPPPKHSMLIRFEDFVLQQDRELQRLEKYLGLPMSKIEMHTAPIGRWITDTDCHYFDFFAEDMQELGYELNPKESARC